MSYNYLSRYPFALNGKYDGVDLASETLISNFRAKSEIRELMMKSSSVDEARYAREFCTPQPPTSTRGYYYPKEPLSFHMESASTHVPYLCRPMFNWKTPSKYGYSKWVTVRKL